MNTQQINFKWVVKHVPIYLQIVFLVLSAISAFEGGIKCCTVWTIN